MIIGEQKPFEEIKESIIPYHKVLVMGCGTCVAVCMAGGEKEAEVLAAQLRMSAKLEGRDQEIRTVTVQRQCEDEYLAEAAEAVGWADVVLSLACGIGIQTANAHYPEKLTLPGLNTLFLGQPTEHGVWEERCHACGECLLGRTGGICPVARCSKQLLNGPCGGSQDGRCEVNPDIPCAWQQIYDRLAALGRLDLFLAPTITPPKDWSKGLTGVPGRVVREDLRLDKEA